MRATLLFSATTLFMLHGSAQDLKLHPHFRGHQEGVAVKAVLEIAERSKLTYRLGLSGGVGSYIAGNGLYGSLHGDIMIYSNGFGSPKLSNGYKAWEIDLVLSGTVIAGFQNRLSTKSSVGPGKRNDPLYYFANFTRPPLQSPFNYSLSLGSNLVFNPRHKHPFQQVGFANMHAGPFQFSYFNDGTPFQRIILGDGKDRYYTGGGIITISLPATNLIDLFELSYHKYSGYVPGAFETANMLDLSFVNYSDNFENFYNKSMVSFNAASTTHHFQFGVSMLNQTRNDIQHRIHQQIFNAFHRVPHKSYVTPRFSLYRSTAKIGLQ